MTKLPQISEAEFEVMKIVWKYAPINTNEITERLVQSTSWRPKTSGKPFISESLLRWRYYSHAFFLY